MSEPRAAATNFATENTETTERNTAAKQELLFSAFSGEVIGAFRTVHWRLGFGFVESVYANALELEFKKRSIPYEREVSVTVMYDGVLVGRFRADFITHGRILVELKSVEALQPIHGVQTLNYLRSTGIELALLLNFGPRPTLRRFICSSAQRSKALL
jgi:GxxExxY protein